MAKKSQPPVIQPLENYNSATDDEIVSLATAVAKGMTGNPKFPAPPADPAVLKTETATFSGLIADAKDGSKKVIAEKDRQRHTIVDMLKLLARYVEVMSKGEMADFTSSGFQPKAKPVPAPAEPLPTPGAPTVMHGTLTGQLLIQIKKIRKARAYKIRYAPVVNGVPGNWTEQLVGSVKSPFPVNGLTPGTVYAFQVQAQGKQAYTNFSDSALFMAT